MFTTVVNMRWSFQTWHPSPCSRASLNKEDVVVYVPLERDSFVVNIICNGIFGMFAFTIKLDKPPTSYIFLSRHHKQRRWQWWNDDDNDETAFTLTFASAFALASVLTRTLAFALVLVLRTRTRARSCSHSHSSSRSRSRLRSHSRSRRNETRKEEW